MGRYPFSSLLTDPHLKKLCENSASYARLARLARRASPAIAVEHVVGPEVPHLGAGDGGGVHLCRCPAQAFHLASAPAVTSGDTDHIAGWLTAGVRSLKVFLTI